MGDQIAVRIDQVKNKDKLLVMGDPPFEKEFIDSVFEGLVALKLGYIRTLTIIRKSDEISKN